MALSNADRQRLANTPGLISRLEGERLARIAGEVHRRHAIVELGSHTGLSTLWMGHASRGAHVYAIDPWGPPRPDSEDDPLGLGDHPYDRFAANVAAHRLGDRITALRAGSLDVAPMWTHPIGLLFIDAVHEEWHVRNDLQAWTPFVVPGGYVALHDWTDDPAHPYFGVSIAAAELALEMRWVVQPRTGSLWVARRSSL